MATFPPVPDWLRQLVREPLVQFALIGLVIFAADRLTSAPTVDPNEIVVDDVVYRELVAIYEEEHDRKPPVEKLEEMLEIYLITETLVREAREMRLADGDQMMRERLAQRMRSMLYSSVEPAIPPDDELRAWYEARADQYATPDTVSFDIIGLDTEEAEARAIAARLNAGEAEPADFPTLVAFKGRLRQQMETLFGAPMVDTVLALEAGRWSAIDTPGGWQVVAFRDFEEGALLPYEDVRERVIVEWRRIQTHKEARAALEQLRKRYPVRRNPIDPALLSGASATDGARAVAEADQ